MAVNSPYGNGYGYNSPMESYEQRMAQLQQQYPGYFNQNAQQPMPQQMQQYQQQPAQQYQQPQVAQPVQQYQQPVVQQPQAVPQVQQQPSYVRGRQVTNEEEARGAVLEDLSLYVFPSVQNKRIYTKNIDSNGNPAFNTYILDESEPVVEVPKEYAEKGEVSELYERINNLQNEIKNLKEELGSGSNSTTVTSDNGKSKSKSNDKPNVAE